MTDLSLAMPKEICAELGRRVRVRRLGLNLTVVELAGRAGLTERTLRQFEVSGRCQLETFISILDALSATTELQTLLDQPVHSIQMMRDQAATPARQRARRKAAKGAA